ncbi:MAG: hypothetical protein HY700_10040 [Gemmatimonadetes bacterium]|nr:hypothetical protein [Gemmatimonadota bacterium]
MTIRWLLLTIAFVLVTHVFGWWAVPLLGAIWGLVGKDTVRPAIMAGVAAASAWALLLGWSGLVGPVGTLAAQLGALAAVPGVLFVGLTLVVPFLLAGSAAAATFLIAAGLGRAERRRDGSRKEPGF